MTDTLTTQKDLDLLDDILPPGDKGGKDAEPAEGAKDAAEKETPKSDGLFDGLDDDDDKGADKPKGKPAEGDAAEAKDKPAEGADADGKADAKDEPKGEADKATDEAWRDRVADKILGPLKDKLSAKKFEQRRESLMGQLKRLKTPEDAAASWVMLNEKVRSGDHKRLSEEASPEEAAAWRKENGIPEAPEKYDIPAIPGHVWSDADNPTLATFKATAHAVDLNQSQVNKLTEWWVAQQRESEAEYDAKLKQLDRQDKEACHDAIRAEMGISEFKPSMAIMKRFIEDEEVFGDGAAEKIISARYFDEETGMWRRLTSLPEIARGLIGLATERYGEGAMVSADGRPSVTANRLDELDKIMKTDYDRYVREGMADEAMAIRRKQEERENKRASRR
jgi:hypothetical protein